jgi:hypothetical protein
MATGPGKYDSFLTQAREAAGAHSAILIVFGGKMGDGFSCQATAEVTASLPVILRFLADDIEKSIPGEIWQA